MVNGSARRAIGARGVMGPLHFQLRKYRGTALSEARPRTEVALFSELLRIQTRNLLRTLERGDCHSTG